GIRYLIVTGVQTCALPICARRRRVRQARLLEAVQRRRLRPVRRDLRAPPRPARRDSGRARPAVAERRRDGAGGARARGGPPTLRSEERRAGKECRAGSATE